MNNNLPHEFVYVRLGISKIKDAGIGVIAIRRIPKGTNPFQCENDPEIVELDKEFINDLPKNIKKMYLDFCVFKGNKMVCPKNFNEMNCSWYLNTSKENNMDTDEELNFIANRDIEIGEELYSNYDEYSEK